MGIPYVKLFFLAFIIMAIGMVLLMISAIIGGIEISGGMGFLIFPFIPIPIVAGFGPHANLVLLIILVLMVVFLIVFFLLKLYL
jgi:hypothetical protein